MSGMWVQSADVARCGSGMSGMWVQSAVCADVARCGSGMSGMWPRGSRTLVHMTMGKPLYHYLYSIKNDMNNS